MGSARVGGEDDAVEGGDIDAEGGYVAAHGQALSLQANQHAGACVVAASLVEGDRAEAAIADRRADRAPGINVR